MENYRVELVWFSTTILLLLCCAKAENKSQPLKNVNLSPFWQWRGAYECMLNTSRCLEKHKIKLDGVININEHEVADYCKVGGCIDDTMDVLLCIHLAKHDFWFANKATVQIINQTIINGCKSPQGFATAHYYSSSALKVYQKTYVSLISILGFLAIFNNNM